MYQGIDNAAVYCTKLKKLWDELVDSFEVPMCNYARTCTTIKQTVELDQRRKFIQFLTQLNDYYDTVVDQILLINPLPIVKKAYSMIRMVKKHKQVINTVALLKK